MFKSQTTKVLPTKTSSWLTRATAIVSEYTNLLTLVGNTIISAGLVFDAASSLLGGLATLGNALAVSAITHGMLARSARRAQKTSKVARKARTMSGPRALRHLFGSAARLAFTPILLSFNITAVTPLFSSNDASQTLQNAENAAPDKSQQINQPLKEGEVLIALPVAKRPAAAQFSL